MIYGKLSTALTLSFGPILDSTGAEYTGAAVADVKISKNNGTPAALNGSATLTHKEVGMYELVLTTSDISAVGVATLQLSKTTYVAPPIRVVVLPAKVYDSIVGGTDNLEIDVIQLLGTAWLTPVTAGTPDVNAKLLGGTAQVGRDIGTSVLLSAGTGTGQLDFTSGVVKSSLVQILGTALTETAGQIAAAFKKFFNIATPAATMDHGVLVDTVTTVTNQMTAAGVRSALGMAAANFDTQIATLATSTALSSFTANFTFTVAGQVDVNVKSWRDNGVPASNVLGVPIVDHVYILGVTQASTVSGYPDVNVLKVNGTTQTARDIGLSVLPADGSIKRATFAADTGLQPARSGTAQGGGASTITLDSGASATNNIYRGQRVHLTGGTGAGQDGLIIQYVGSTKVATIHEAWVTQPDNTTTFAIKPDAMVRVDLWGSTGATIEADSGNGYPQTSTAGTKSGSTVDANLTKWEGVTPLALSSQKVQAVAVVAGAYLATGTVASTTGGTTTLDSGAVASANYYNGDILVITAGTGAGQDTIITAYSVGRVATHTAWTVNPDNTSTYEIRTGKSSATVTGGTVRQITITEREIGISD